MNKEDRSFAEILQVNEEFSNLMNELGIPIKKGSILEEVCLSCKRYLGMDNRFNYDNKQDSREIWRMVVGFYDLSVKILRVKDHPNFHELREHLKLLNKGRFPQNIINTQSDQAARKIYELLLATLVMTFADNMKVDSPVSSSGDNPDIIFTYKNIRWAIACKVLQSNSNKRFWSNLKKGVDQIERSKVDYGFVSFNFKNIIPHDQLMPIVNKSYKETGEDIHYEAFSSIEKPYQILKQFCGQKRLQILNNCSNNFEYITKMLSGKKALPSTTNLCFSTSSVVHKDKPHITKVGFFWYMPFQENPCAEIAKLMNLAFHDFDVQDILSR